MNYVISNKDYIINKKQHMHQCLIQCKVQQHMECTQRVFYLNAHFSLELLALSQTRTQNNNHSYNYSSFSVHLV